MSPGFEKLLWTFNFEALFSGNWVNDCCRKSPLVLHSLQVRRGADRAEIYSLAFSPTAQWLAVSSDKGTIHVFGLKVNAGSPVTDVSRNSSEPNLPPTSGSSLSFIKGKIPAITSFFAVWGMIWPTSVANRNCHLTIFYIGCIGWLKDPYTIVVHSFEPGNMFKWKGECTNISKDFFSLKHFFNCHMTQIFLNCHMKTFFKWQMDVCWLSCSRQVSKNLYSCTIQNLLEEKLTRKEASFEVQSSMNQIESLAEKRGLTNKQLQF